ncbi:MAG: cytochrome c oxidase assembly protein [Actinomycetales bacterium]|uniref:cytochrome c oxidase assembly protein n=1 Tax=uncultured Salinibacterium sp. TaxID=459274 RepID=UPI0030DBE977|tara:strand:+ start:12244 stop:13203 length:960 start_codon:yes stop_codon:yes gene_type:complete
MNADWVSIPDSPPSLGQFLAFDLQPVPLIPIIGVALAAVYLLGAVRLWASGRPWPVWRTLTFLLGCLIIVIVTGLGVEGYGYVMLSVFMFQQLTLMMLVPPLLILGLPGTLLLRATPHHGLGRFVLRFAFIGLRSRGSRWLLHPVVTVPLFLFFFYGLYLAGLADLILALPFGHLGLELSFLAAGILFTIPILSDDPLPVRMSFPARVLDLTAEVALHAFFGVIVMMSPFLLADSFGTPPPSMGVNPLADQGIAGGLAWSYGEAPTVLMMLYILRRWFHDDTSKAALADRRSDVHGDTELDAYNEYLAELRNRELRRPW